MSSAVSANFDIDVAVIGAGIHGAGMAQAAAAAGHSVLVLEQTAIAAGTSSRSSKLIHGGLRYLETGQLHLVRESLHERATLLRLAPELVHLQRFYIPLYAHTRRRPWQLRTGLSLYALLAGLGREARFESLPPHGWNDLDGLTRSGLERVYCYHDAQTDDRALTRAVLHSAQSLGVRLLCPAQFIGATLCAVGLDLRFLIEGREQQCRARVLINAAGPWADTLASRIAPAIPVPSLQRVQGAHIVLAGQLQRGIYYVESPRDGRAIFVMPWQGRVLVGTTETRFRGDPGTVSASHTELHYLLGVLKAYFPAWRTAELTDIADSFAGLRLLPGGPGHAFHRSRETLLVSDRAVKPRVLSIYGGKLTTYRAVAQRALARVADSLPKRVALARTDQLPLSAR
ncbi:MAG TPA: FAD-dependent oxidoreductase [Steroidobacteraceae bacterium]